MNFTQFRLYIPNILWVLVILLSILGWSLVITDCFEKTIFYNKTQELDSLKQDSINIEQEFLKIDYQDSL